MTDKSLMPPVHPGEILAEEYLEPLGVTQHRLAVEIGVPPRRINEIVHGKRGISADTALRLARFFGTSERFWLNLQSRCAGGKTDSLGAQVRSLPQLVGREHSGDVSEPDDK